MNPADHDWHRLQLAFGSGLSTMRADRNLTLEGLSQRAGLGLYHLSRIESGHQMPTLRTLVKLSGALRVLPDKLLECWRPMMSAGRK